MSRFLTTQLLVRETKEMSKQQTVTFYSLWLEKRKSGSSRRGPTLYCESVQFLLFFGLSEAMQSAIIRDFLGSSNLHRNTHAFEVHFVLAKRITHYAEEAVRDFSKAIRGIEKVRIYSLVAQLLNAVNTTDLGYNS